ncbi:hypothetical protein SAY87_024851 [Trapa incisa]|uniref:RING-CH-type domain-containing protein n=1 Tax=Trapa incisa TaxID=236973 RepID=A0AAN7JG91_9MYRT|nr:hypothetical protein SAY87_024851 [Trapa incisa]
MLGDGLKSNGAGLRDHGADISDPEGQGRAPESNSNGLGGCDNVLIAAPGSTSPPPPPPELLGTVPQLVLTVPLTIVVSDGESHVPSEGTGRASEAMSGCVEASYMVDSPKKGHLSRSGSSHEQCRVCQQEMEEVLIDLGCQCRGGVGKAHLSCINTWFRSRGSNKCEICQQAAVNVPPPEPLAAGNSWTWWIDPSSSSSFILEQRRTCLSPLWVAFLILIGGLLLDVLIFIIFGVSALPVNITIGVIIVLGLGAVLRLVLEFCQEWNLRRVVQRIETNVNLGYHPAL